MELCELLHALKRNTVVSVVSGKSVDLLKEALISLLALTYPKYLVQFEV